MTLETQVLAGQTQKCDEVEPIIGISTLKSWQLDLKR